MRFIILSVAILAAFAFSAEPVPSDSLSASDSAVVTPAFDGIPWNHSSFPRERLLRRTSIDPALSAAFSYSVSFMGGSYGSFAQQSYLAHLAYEFDPSLHLYADFGLWMPLYANFRAGAPIPKEDIKQGKVEFILPAIALEYKPTDNSYIRLMFVNENDAIKAYGPFRYPSCYWRNSIFCR